MRQDDPVYRRQVKMRPSAEALESRQLLTRGAGSLFAIIPGEISSPGSQTSVPITVDTTLFTLPRQTMYLGIDVSPASESSVQPRVESVTATGGGEVSGVVRSVYSPFVKDEKLVTNAPTSAVLVSLRVDVSETGAGALSATTTIRGEESSAGKFLAGYYLPGDANGDGRIDASDLTTIRGALGSVAGDAAYNFDADSNRDGRIGAIDLIIANYNNGVETRVQPVISANLAAMSDSGTQDRVTVYRDVYFEGEATPGTTITYTEKAGKPPPASTVAGSDGKYSLMISLGEGENTFEVSSQDPFGQTIRGAIAPVTYLKPLVPVESPRKEPTTGTTSPTPSTPKPASSDESAQLEALKKRFPNAFKQMSPDQAENLRKRLAAQTKSG